MLFNFLNIIIVLYNLMYILNFIIFLSIIFKEKILLYKDFFVFYYLIIIIFLSICKKIGIYIIFTSFKNFFFFFFISFIYILIIFFLKENRIYKKFIYFYRNKIPCFLEIPLIFFSMFILSKILIFFLKLKINFSFLVFFSLIIIILFLKFFVVLIFFFILLVIFFLELLILFLQIYIFVFID